MRDRARNVLRWRWGRTLAAHDADRLATRLADHLVDCSCVMCGNPRRFAKGEHSKTMQERRAEIEFVDDDSGTQIHLTTHDV